MGFGQQKKLRSKYILLIDYVKNHRNKTPVHVELHASFVFFSSGETMDRIQLYRMEFYEYYSFRYHPTHLNRKDIYQWFQFIALFAFQSEN